MSSSEPLWRRSARDVVACLRSGDLSPTEVVEAAIARIETVDPVVNCVPIRDFDRARSRAEGFTRRGHADESDLLAGLPITIKDLTDVEGLPTTLGDPQKKNTVASVSDALVRRLERRGGIVIGKTNVPYLGLGSDTDNPLFGLTLNPWNTDYSTAGSSGGAAAALACGEAWLAQGSDLGGSIRGPASHCGIVGLRPSPGRVGHGGPGTRRMPLDMLNVDGPMARDVGDLALFMDALAGFEPTDPFSMDSASGMYTRASMQPALPGSMIAMHEMDGVVAEPDVAAVFDAAIARLEAAGVQRTADGPDFTGIADTAYTLRLGATRARTSPEDFARMAEHLPEIAGRTHEDASKLDVDAFLAASERQQVLVRQMAEHLSADRVLITPAVSHGPRPHRRAQPDLPLADDHWAREAVFAYAITLSLCPALVVPAGFSATGLPVGIQIVGPPRGEAQLFAVGRAVEEVLNIPRTLPIDPVPPDGSMAID